MQKELARSVGHPLLLCDLLNECRRRLNPTQVELACQSNPADREPFQYKVRQGETLERRKMLNKLFHIVENQRMFKSKLCIG